VRGGILIVNAAGRVVPSCWVSMEGAFELFSTRGRVPPGLGVLPYRVLARYTHSKPRLVLPLPVTNDKWLVALHLKNGMTGSSLRPLAHCDLPPGGFGGSGR